MGWFDEQIRQRKQGDREAFEDAFAKIAHAAGGKIDTAFNDSSEYSRNAMEEILTYFHVKSKEVPENIKNNDERLEYLMRPYGIMRRTVYLDKDWHKDASGAMLAVKKEDGSVVALIPSGFCGYCYLDADSGKRIRVGNREEGLFEKEAVVFYKPIPLKKLGVQDLLRYAFRTISGADLFFLALLTLAVVLLGMVTPYLNHVIFADVMVSGNMQLPMAAGIFMVCASASSVILSGVKGLINARLTAKMGIAVESAAMMRMVSLPVDFFKQYASGELSLRIQYISPLCRTLVSVFLQAALAAMFSLVYAVQFAVYAPAPAVPAFAVLTAMALFSFFTFIVRTKTARQRMEAGAKEGGMVYALISGIQKIRLSGAEKRAFARWGDLYTRLAKIEYHPPALIRLNRVILMAVSLTGTFAIYYVALKSHTSVADYYAFHVAYGMVSGAFLTLVSVVSEVADIRPALDMIEPILEAEPEIAEEKQVLGRISGGIEFNNVSFRYGENMPFILDDLSLKIRPGQYVAIVGTTGCGKSTMMRLMLGFERPQKGAVYYDGKDISTVDLKSLRQKIGVVMQDGKLFAGDIYSNIIMLAPQLGMDGAWEAAELAGIAEDIRNMPMGMFTMVSEGRGGISGGQRQRIMIARAVASKPRILMFDEATSALDNITQKTVSESLAGLKCTRIVIAHRLSTIRQCDRILVLDRGKIVEDGKYDELIAANGFFAELVARQQVEKK